MKKFALGIMVMLSLVFLSRPNTAQAARSDENIVLINPKNLTPKKTSKNTLYWGITPKKMVNAVNSILVLMDEDRTPANEIKKVKDKNIFQIEQDGVMLSMFTLGNQVEKSAIHKITLTLNYEYLLKEEDFNQFVDYAVAIVGIFSGYDADITSQVLTMITDKDDEGSIKLGTVQYSVKYTDEQLTLTIQPYQK